MSSVVIKKSRVVTVELTDEQAILIRALTGHLYFDRSNQRIVKAARDLHAQLSSAAVPSVSTIRLPGSVHDRVSIEDNELTEVLENWK